MISPEQSKAQKGTGAGVDDGTTGDLKKSIYISTRSLGGPPGPDI